MVGAGLKLDSRMNAVAIGIQILKEELYFSYISVICQLFVSYISVIFQLYFSNHRERVVCENTALKSVCKQMANVRKLNSLHALLLTFKYLCITSGSAFNIISKIK